MTVGIRKSSDVPVHMTHGLSVLTSVS